jgi:hypothetical protein
MVYISYEVLHSSTFSALSVVTSACTLTRCVAENVYEIAGGSNFRVTCRVQSLV